MPPPLLIDLANLDLDKICFDREQIYNHLPHRYEFMVLDGVCHVDAEAETLVAFRDVRADDWWAKGHVPGRPIFPGALMLEMAGQATALLAKLTYEPAKDVFIAFGGVDECKFRDSVTPPARMHILATLAEKRSRRITGRTQAVVGDRLIFEARIAGMALR